MRRCKPPPLATPVPLHRSRRKGSCTHTSPPQRREAKARHTAHPPLNLQPRASALLQSGRPTWRMPRRPTTASQPPQHPPRWNRLLPRTAWDPPWARSRSQSPTPLTGPRSRSTTRRGAPQRLDALRAPSWDTTLWLALTEITESSWSEMTLPRSARCTLSPNARFGLRSLHSLENRSRPCKHLTSAARPPQHWRHQSLVSPQKDRPRKNAPRRVPLRRSNGTHAR